MFSVSTLLHKKSFAVFCTMSVSLEDLLMYRKIESDC